MTRAFNIQGETLLTVKGGEHLSGAPMYHAAELGLAQGPIEVSPTFFYRDIHVDDFGPHVPVAVQWQLAYVTIRCTLIYFDKVVLGQALAESMAIPISTLTASTLVTDFESPVLGYVGPTGFMLGGRKLIHASGNHLFSLTLKGPPGGNPHTPEDQFTNAHVRFLQCHFESQPTVHKWGTKVSTAEIAIRALPYADPYRSGGTVRKNRAPWTITRDGIQHTLRDEIVNSGALIWDFTADEPAND